jgi:uncharacterized membrane protein SpoIIM required for sporulation
MSLPERYIFGSVYMMKRFMADNCNFMQFRQKEKLESYAHQIRTHFDRSIKSRKDNIKMNLNKVGCEGVAGFIWLNLWIVLFLLWIS